MIAGTRRNFMVYTIPSGRPREITTTTDAGKFFESFEIEFV